MSIIQEQVPGEGENYLTAAQRQRLEQQRQQQRAQEQNPPRQAPPLPPGHSRTTTYGNGMTVHVGPLEDGLPPRQFRTPPPQVEDSAARPAGPVSFTPVPNPLNAYDQPVYWIRWFLKGDQSTANTDASEVTIAETGRTGINIESLKIESIVGPTMQTQVGTATSITMEIFEPFGCRLPDMLLEAAATLNIQNYLKARWTLEVQFQGYNEDGSVAHYQTPGGKRDWTWHLLLRNIESHVSEAGARHTVTAVPWIEQAMDNQYGMLQTAVDLPAVTLNPSIGKKVEHLVAHLNSDAQFRYGPGHISYEIVCEPYEEEDVIGRVRTPFDHEFNVDQAATNSPHMGHFQFSAGTEIASVFQTMFARCDTAIKLARYTRMMPNIYDPTIEARTPPVQPYVVFHRVEMHVENNGYNPYIRDYRKKIKYVIKPYRSIRPVASTSIAHNYEDPEGHAEETTNFNRRKIEMATRTALMCKQYDYIFTGKNTEVERFDINLNFRWHVAVPQLASGNHYNRLNVPAEIVEDRHALREEAQRLQHIWRGYQEAINEADPETRSRRLEAVNQEMAAIAPAIVQDLDRRRDEFEETVSQGRTVLAEKLVEGQRRASLPVTLIQQGDANLNTEWGAAGPSHEGVSVYGSLLNQLHGAFDGNLQNIELVVRGDPYWLGGGRPYNPSTAASSRDEANFINGEHMFVFRFKMPLGSGDNQVELANSSDLRHSDIYTGFYATVGVTHDFSKGKFTQTLRGVRIPGAYYQDIIAGSEGSGGSTDE